MRIEHLQKQTNVWIGFDERNHYKQNASYQEAVAESKRKGQSLCVFVGGEQPLLPTIDSLIHAKELS